MERSGGLGVAVRSADKALFSFPPPLLVFFSALPLFAPTSFQSPMNESECFTMPGILSEQSDAFGLKKRKRNVAQEEAINLADP